ncbi:MAG TPA: hypoxanthine phosphoribosyltransferase [Gemmataceae bacterium]|nr:hypoxanthine phosphoribosyltransferase [Gemmataceae bacterium]
MEILISADRIQQRIDELAREIVAVLPRQEPVTIVGVLTGSLIFLSDLIRRLDLSLKITLIQASSYRGASTRPGKLHIEPTHPPDLKGRHVLLLDDILDTGQTVSKLVPYLQSFEPLSLRVAVLLRKLGRQEVPFEPDFCGFEIPDAFVVGYGLDYNDEYRHLPFIGILPTNSPTS